MRFCFRSWARRGFVLSCTLGLAAFAAAEPLKVDFSIAGRPDSFAPGFEQWIVPASARTDTKTFNGVSVTVSAVAPRGKGLATAWWKGGAIAGAKMSVDALTIDDGDSGAQLELRLAGLTPGRHTLATFHNVSDNGDHRRLGKFDVLVNGVPQLTGIIPSHGVTSDYATTSAYLSFDVKPGAETAILFRSQPGDTAALKNIVLCGFELDGSDPHLRASKPVPADRDEHVEADRATVTATWLASPAASAHLVFFGRSREGVTAATVSSPEFQAKENLPRHEFKGLNPHEDYFWRVDTIDASGGVTKGETWHFRPRRVAFPGAEGYGRFARGGRGGRVIEVTNLNDRGPGSLRAAVEAAGPRTVVFAVSGLITLQSKLVVKNPYLTVAGQTAPGKGITLRQYNFGLLGTHDVMVRFIRVRPGDISRTTLDGMGMAGSDHSIIDHCSISWTIDESFSSRGAQNITLQHTLISEALNEAGHKNYPRGSRHGYAASISGMVGSFHHNLLAHNSGRNWSLAGGLDQAGHHTGWLDIRNNVVYNWDNRTTDGGAAKVNYVNNYYKPGPASRVFHVLKPERNNIQGFGPQDYFIAGNVMEGRVSANDPLGGVIEPNPARHAPASGDAVLDHDDARPSRFEPLASFVKDRPFFEPFVETESAALAYKRVLSDVGCTLPLLDEHDTRVIRETRDTTFTFRGSKTKFPGLPDSQEDVGGWENYPEVHRPADWDNDHDGLPDWWETLHGLNPHSRAGDSTDSNAVSSPAGFTQLENYLNWLAQPHADCPRGDSLEIDLAGLTSGFVAKPVHTIARVSHGEARVLENGYTVRFTPEPAFAGLASFDFTVTDASGDAFTQTVGIAVR